MEQVKDRPVEATAQGPEIVTSGAGPDAADRIKANADFFAATRSSIADTLSARQNHKTVRQDGGE